MINLRTPLHKILFAALGAVGIAGCDNNRQECMYGVPTQDYTLRGTVTDLQGSPLRGIEVTNEVFSDTIVTKEDGCYSFHWEDFPHDGATHSLTLRDLNGTEDGHYEDTTVEYSFRNIEPEGGRNVWYNGEAILDLNIKMRKI